MKKRLLAALPLCALAACSSSPAPSFAPLDYSYLRPIVLKVANLNVVDNYVPGPDEATLEGKDPAPPASTLTAMLQHRLQPSGEPGNGTVTIQVASITEANGNLNGAMTVDVNLTSADGHSTGFAEANVSASQTAPDSDNPADLQAALYQMTKRLMDQMNVQLPYQIMHNIPSWVVSTGPGAAMGAGAAPAGAAGGAIEATPLTAPGGAAAPSAPVPAVAPATGAAPTYLPGAGPAALGVSPQ